MRAAWALERSWSKAQILEAYLNLATFRGEVQGVGAASGVLLGKVPSGIGGAEAAVLAALLRQPDADRPTLRRRALALRRFLENSPPCALRAPSSLPDGSVDFLRNEALRLRSGQASTSSA